jgi:hypothetical protein
MDDFNTPGSNKSWMDEGFKKFVVDTQLHNICKILGGEANHYICTDKKTQHEKIIIEYNHQKKK